MSILAVLASRTSEYVGAGDMVGVLRLWPVMLELPGVLPHRAIAKIGTSTTFASGNREDRSSLRQEITRSVSLDVSLEYAHAWGMPGGDFEERSSCSFRPL
jgi:hypothetical protein